MIAGFLLVAPETVAELEAGEDRGLSEVVAVVTEPRSVPAVSRASFESAATSSSTLEDGGVSV